MPEVSNLFVCLMGMGVTFFGLICLILLTMVMGKDRPPQGRLRSCGPSRSRPHSGSKRHYQPSGTDRRHLCGPG